MSTHNIVFLWKDTNMEFVEKLAWSGAVNCIFSGDHPELFVSFLQRGVFWGEEFSLKIKGVALFMIDGLLGVEM